MKFFIIFPLFFLNLSSLSNTSYDTSGDKPLNPDSSRTEQYEEIEILDKTFFFLEKGHGREPVVAIWLFNNTHYTISNIVFRAELKSYYEEIPWVDDEFGYTPQEWLKPWDTLYFEINYVYNWDWDNPDIDDAFAELNIEILSVYDTLGKMILQNFSPEEDSAGQE
ncbi:hypothetical protein JXA84_04910 [candidate division WOR-3 bacterium]|nr:hypothetical protein [candidate division WOR-3 bacterium]